MEAVRKQCSDLPYDSENPLFPLWIWAELGEQSRVSKSVLPEIIPLCGVTSIH